jgi:hypothetical protein
MEQEEAGRFWIRMEEEEEEGWVKAKGSVGFLTPAEGQPGEQQRAASRIPEVVADLLRSLALERQKILDNDKLSAKEKLALLDENRKALTVGTGGRVTKTDSVVYGILIFGGAVLVILALLTAFANLPKEVTISFVGTVLGGVIATIAQKLGKI